MKRKVACSELCRLTCGDGSCAPQRSRTIGSLADPDQKDASRTVSRTRELHRLVTRPPKFPGGNRAPKRATYRAVEVCESRLSWSVVHRDSQQRCLVTRECR